MSQIRFIAETSPASSSANRAGYTGPPPCKQAHYDNAIVQQAQNRQQLALSTPNRKSVTPASVANSGSINEIDDSDSITSVRDDVRTFLTSRYEIQMSNDIWSRTRRFHEKPTGLRHFSTKVCEKVKEKQLTNYNEVADELVVEYFEHNMIHHVDQKQEYEMKNIRRRVYDALNVLLAMNIIEKNKKDISWVGLPVSSAQEIQRLQEEKIRREVRIREKLESLQEMIVQLVTYKSLVAKNREEERLNGRPDQSSLLYLPFIIVNTDKRAMVECSVANDKAEYLFSFDQPFEIHDDVEVLKRMGLGCGLDSGDSTDEERERAKSYLPPLIRPYIDDILAGHMRASRDDELETYENYVDAKPVSMNSMRMIDRHSTECHQEVDDLPPTVDRKPIMQPKSSSTAPRINISNVQSAPQANQSKTKNIQQNHPNVADIKHLQQQKIVGQNTQPKAGSQASVHTSNAVRVIGRDPNANVQTSSISTVAQNAQRQVAQTATGTRYYVQKNPMKQTIKREVPQTTAIRQIPTMSARSQGVVPAVRAQNPQNATRYYVNTNNGYIAAGPTATARITTGTRVVQRAPTVQRQVSASAQQQQPRPNIAAIQRQQLQQRVQPVARQQAEIQDRPQVQSARASQAPSRSAQEQAQNFDYDDQEMEEEFSDLVNGDDLSMIDSIETSSKYQ